MYIIVQFSGTTFYHGIRDIPEIRRFRSIESAVIVRQGRFLETRRADRRDPKNHETSPESPDRVDVGVQKEESRDFSFPVYNERSGAAVKFVASKFPRKRIEGAERNANRFGIDRRREGEEFGRVLSRRIRHWQ